MPRSGSTGSAARGALYCRIERVDAARTALSREAPAARPRIGSAGAASTSERGWGCPL